LVGLRVVGAVSKVVYLLCIRCDEGGREVGEVWEGRCFDDIAD